MRAISVYVTATLPSLGVRARQTGAFDQGAQSGNDITASQSRLNFEVRKQSKNGAVGDAMQVQFSARYNFQWLDKLY